MTVFLCAKFVKCKGDFFQKIYMTDFSIFNKETSLSFKKQKGFIKRVLTGKNSHCPECGNGIELILPELNFHKKNTQKNPGIYCKKGCTDIELDMDAVNV